LKRKRIGCDKHFPLESIKKLFRGISFFLGEKASLFFLEVRGESAQETKNIGLEFARFRPISLRLSPVAGEVTSNQRPNTSPPFVSSLPLLLESAKREKRIEIVFLRR
jgi:hypothetical protein